MGSNYNPRSNWNSQRRTRADFPLLSSPKHDESTFSFADVTGTFTKLLLASSPDFAGSAMKEWIDKSLIYHLDVKTTRGGLQEEFAVSDAMVKRAREWSIMVQQMKGDVGEAPKDVYVLVRVYDMAVAREEKVGGGEKGKEKEESGPQAVFLVDPWDAYHKDRLILKSKGGMVGSMV